MARRCAIDCPKVREYRRELEAKNENIHKSTSQEFQVSDVDFDVSDATEYQSLPGRSAPTSRESGRQRLYVEPPAAERARREFTCDQPRRHGLRSPEKIRDRRDNYVSEHTPRSAERKQQSSLERPAVDYKTPARHGPRKRKLADSPRSQTKRCGNDDCAPNSGDLFRRRGRIQSDVSYRNSQSSNDSTQSLSCPELCERDPARLPIPKSRCDSSCPKQARLDAQREKRQEAADKYVLTSGIRYFDDLCHCSLKCLMTQICMDPFIKKTVASAAFFFLGMKLCFELDSWFIAF